MNYFTVSVNKCAPEIIKSDIFNILGRSETVGGKISFFQITCLCPTVDPEWSYELERAEIRLLMMKLNQSLKTSELLTDLRSQLELSRTRKLRAAVITPADFTDLHLSG